MRDFKDLFQRRKPNTNMASNAPPTTDPPPALVIPSTTETPPKITPKITPKPVKPLANDCKVYS